MHARKADTVVSNTQCQTHLLLLAGDLTVYYVAFTLEQATIIATTCSQVGYLTCDAPVSTTERLTKRIDRRLSAAADRRSNDGRSIKSHTLARSKQLHHRHEYYHERIKALSIKLYGFVQLTCTRSMSRWRVECQHIEGSAKEARCNLGARRNNTPVPVCNPYTNHGHSTSVDAPSLLSCTRTSTVLADSLDVEKVERLSQLLYAVFMNVRDIELVRLVLAPRLCKWCPRVHWPTSIP